MRSATPADTAPRFASVAVDGWAGRHEYACLVVGETPKRYRIRAVVKDTPLPRRRLQVGDEALVPKHAVRFTNGN